VLSFVYKYNKFFFVRLLFVAGTNREDYEGNKAYYGEHPIAVKKVI